MQLLFAFTAIMAAVERTLEALAVDLDQFFLVVCGIFVLCKYIIVYTYFIYLAKKS